MGWEATTRGTAGGETTTGGETGCAVAGSGGDTGAKTGGAAAGNGDETGTMTGGAAAGNGDETGTMTGDAVAGSGDETGEAAAGWRPEDPFFLFFFFGRGAERVGREGGTVKGVTLSEEDPPDVDSQEILLSRFPRRLTGGEELSGFGEVGVGSPRVITPTTRPSGIVGKESGDAASAETLGLGRFIT